MSDSERPMGATQARIERFETAEALAVAASCRIVDDIGAAFRRRRRAVLALAGGRTPFRIYEALSRWPLRWEWVDIVPTSERWVGRLSLERNGALIRAKLLKHRAAAANYIPLIEPWDADPGHNALMRATSTAEATMDRLGRLDLALLGMGIDGHIASIFPRSLATPNLLELQSTRCCVLTPPAPAGPLQPRITLSLATIAAARRLIVAIRGERKLERIQAALSEDAPSTPIGMLLKRGRAPVEVLWSP